MDAAFPPPLHRPRTRAGNPLPGREGNTIPNGKGRELQLARHHGNHRGQCGLRKSAQAYALRGSVDANANFGRAHIIVRHRAPVGIAGFVLANGSLSAGGAEGKVRKRIVEADLVDCIVALPACICFLERDRQRQILFNGACGPGSLVDRFPSVSNSPDFAPQSCGWAGMVAPSEPGGTSPRQLVDDDSRASWGHTVPVEGAIGSPIASQRPRYSVYGYRASQEHLLELDTGLYQQKNAVDDPEHSWQVRRLQDFFLPHSTVNSIPPTSVRPLLLTDARKLSPRLYRSNYRQE